MSSATDDWDISFPEPKYLFKVKVLIQILFFRPWDIKILIVRLWDLIRQLMS